MSRSGVSILTHDICEQSKESLTPNHEYRSGVLHINSRVKALVDRLKPLAYVYKYIDETPSRKDAFLDVGVELNVKDNCEFLTFWFHWDHDWEGDQVEDWEPVTYTLINDVLVDIQTRPHWTLVQWLTDNPILENGERAIIYFSKNGHAPYLSIPSSTEIGWLRNTMIKIKMGREIRFAALDFLEVMRQKNSYVKMSNYKPEENLVPPKSSRALTGIAFMGIRLFDNVYKAPKGC